MNIVYLYTEIMPYTVAIFEELAAKGYKVYAYYLDKKKLTPYVPPKIENVLYFKLSNYDKSGLLAEIKGWNPNIVLVAGWANDMFRYVARYFKSRTTVPVVCPIDTQYLKTFKQLLGVLSSPFYVRRLFTHIWVPGVRQYHFASLLGFPPRKILLNSLTAQKDIFSRVDLTPKKVSYPKKILFVGRYHPVKGLDLLIDAWNDIEDKKGWSIVLVGNGPMRDKLKGISGIQVLDFMSQNDLVELSKECGAFVLPSIYEPWALVLDEFAQAGLPIICSDACGASSHLVIDGYNGYTFRTSDSVDLKYKLEIIMAKKSEELYEMSMNSRKLSNYTNPELSAASLISALYR